MVVHNLLFSWMIKKSRVNFVDLEANFYAFLLIQVSINIFNFDIVLSSELTSRYGIV